MKQPLQLKKYAQKDLNSTPDEILSEFENRQQERNRKREEARISEEQNADRMMQRYLYLKQKAEEMGIGLETFITSFGTDDDRRLLPLVRQLESQRREQGTSYEKILELFSQIKEIAESQNIDIEIVWENYNTGNVKKSDLIHLVHNYKRLKNEEKARLEQEKRNELRQQEREYNSPEATLERAIKESEYFTSKWNEIIEKAKQEGVDPEVYVRSLYPDDLAKTIIMWNKIKTGQINGENIEQYIASITNRITNEQIDNFEQNVDQQKFNDIIENLRNAFNEIDWTKVGSFFDEAKNRVIYQFLKPGSIVKKTRDAIQVIMGLLSSSGSQQWSNEYDTNQEAREKAERELDDFVNAKSAKLNKTKIITALNKIANTLDNSKYYQEADKITKIMTKIAASIYDTDQFWIIRGIIRPVTSHEAQTDTIINEQYRNDVLRVLQQNFFLPLKDCMTDEEYNDIFSDMSDFFRREKYDLEETLDFIYDKYSEAHVAEDDDMSKDEYIETTMPKILNMRESFFNAMRNPLDHALQELGWIRVNGNNIEMAKRLDDYTKSTIRRAMDEIFGDKATRMNFNIDSLSGFKTLTYDELY